MHASSSQFPQQLGSCIRRQLPAGQHGSLRSDRPLAAPLSVEVMASKSAQLLILALQALLACARAAEPQRVVVFLPFWSQASLVCMLDVRCEPNNAHPERRILREAREATAAAATAATQCAAAVPTAVSPEWLCQRAKRLPCRPGNARSLRLRVSEPW